MKRRNYFVLCGARGGLRALHLRRLLEKAGENFQKTAAHRAAVLFFEFIFPRGSRVRQAMREADARASCAR